MDRKIQMIFFDISANNSIF